MAFPDPVAPSEVITTQWGNDVVAALAESYGGPDAAPGRRIFVADTEPELVDGDIWIEL